ncbi:ATP-binding protein [Gemmiger formicilis]|uniref:ATP-binding protein n=1 Tax=Gemmiger formicilis TaxID=745368 RepID=UPI003999E78F
MSEYLLTYLWVGMECVTAVLLFDAFSQRKKKRIIHWITVACFAFLDSTLLNLMSPNMASFGRIAIALVAYYSLHRFLYIGEPIFSLYIVTIFYATICCIDNVWFTFLTLILGIQNGTDFNQTLFSGFLVHCLMLVVCYLQLLIRKHNQNQTTNYNWYTIPAVLSAVSVLLIFFFGACFQRERISVLPLFVCATFITCMQIAALLLVSWMEQNAYFREEALSLQTKSMAQKESIEALSAAYAQQRKLTHDFRAHLDTLSAMLEQQPFDINAIESYIHSLQAAQTNRILLVNTHHSALDALLNQKAFVARNRSIDVQFRVNDLSAVKIDLVDLTVIISNTLDNAIEACEKLPVQDRQIHVQVVLDDNELFYAVRNRSLPVDVSSDRLPVTTKESPSFHGYGLQNVQTTLAKYHSVYAMDYADGWFEFATDLPNTLIS